MATIVEMINPLTGLPEQVDKLDHTAQEIDDAVGLAPQLSNPNLLDNWYFGNPVNQLGQASWTNPSSIQYAIDRWQITPSSVAALVDGGITVTAEIQQGLEKTRLEFGRAYTFSVISSDGRLGKHTFVLTSDANINVSFGFGFFVCYLSGNNVWFRIYGDGSTYKAAKLELGSQQTLAHQENGVWVLNEIPDYGEQLARCQRYCIEIVPAVSNDYGAIGSGSAVFTDRVYVCVPLPVTMRAQPTVSYTGNWKLVSGVAAADGFDVNWLAVDKISNNSVTLNVTTANQVLTAGKTYHLWRTPASKNSMLFSADL